ncbi:histidine phosphatase family protein [Hespellia stercorisuis]|uniref:Alpha-ribazole phosphatase n=1 Tax=Hespellia stercorisuis DSM 15480 TaxID=1121950 RepID=A0A1M6KIR5_9FIRM|nr:histidine phosphatase family protein [Hespellia stercorisuis]SHJ58846.1 alpha-ribazole phosphatase [Hespellia stercorisuis DSM 15480]
MWNWTETEIEVTWIRHGMTAANEQHRYLGWTDEALSENGIRKLRECAPSLQNCGNYLVSSPMKRCRQTALLLFGREPDLLIPEWKEMNFGKFEGKNYMDLKGDPEYQRWIDSNGTIAFPEGEAREQFTNRCMAGLNRMMIELEREKIVGSGVQKPKVAAVVHGGTMMAVLSSLSGGEYFDFQVKNGCGYCSTLRRKEGQIMLTQIKEISN